MFTKSRVPQYFFGDDMNQDDKSAKNDSILFGISLNEDFHASEPNLSRIQSPVSSVTSTKKLEWDSGADIGYNIYNSIKNSRRSKSFPTLNMDLSISQINKSDETQDDEITIENKMTDDITKENSSINSHFTNQSKPQQINRKSTFKHSTPYEEKTIFKIPKDNEKQRSKSTDKNKDECLQTTPIHICSKSVQTDDNLLKDDQKVNKSQQTDTIKSSSYSGSSLSKSSSFQYIPGSNKLSTTDNSDIARTMNSHNSEPKLSNCECETGKSKVSISSENHSDESKSSNHSPLGKIIATQQSKHLIKDIDESLQVLHKFINSKNYTSDTKKYYAKKIVTKIITTKYNDDSTSSSNSSSLSPARSREKPVETNMNNKSNDSKDVHDFVAKENKKTNLVNCGVQCDPIQKSVSCETNKNKMIASKLEELISKNNKFTEKSKHKNKSDLYLDKNWRDAETLSEKLFEARKKSSSHASLNRCQGTKNNETTKKKNYIIEHSKNERKRQLSWINNEISYLHRIKELLQKNDSSSNSTVSAESQHTSKSQQTNKSHKTNISHQTNSAEQNIRSSLSDIEIKFYREFGSSNSSNTENIETLRKLSEYLTNDQIKFVINNDAKNVHCQTCEDCKSKQMESSPKQKQIKSPPKQNRSTETDKNKSSLREFVSNDVNNCSFNSHTYKFYENLIRSCNTSNQNSSCLRNQISQVDAGIQCTMRKKKHKIPQNDTSCTVSTDYSKDSPKNIYVEEFYKNVSNFSHSDSQSTEYGKIESDIIPDFIRIPRNGKENNCQKKPVKFRQKQTKSPPSVAYFLTFEEESMSEFAQNLPKKSLEQVTVKVPKFIKTSNNRRYSNETNKPLIQKPACLTLQDYLLKNHPQFIQSADWRRSIIYNHSEKRSRHIFTCSQMKEITSKKYCKLAEVQNKIHNCKVLDQKRHNRCKAKDFSKKLQKKTLTGQLSIATCLNVMSSE